MKKEWTTKKFDTKSEASTSVEQSDWQKVQDFSKDWWDSYSKFNVEDQKPSFYELLGNSIPEETDTINFSSKISCGIDLDVTCQCKNLKIYFWLAEATNWLPDIFSFLEAIICAKSNELFFYLDEEGIDTFLYVKRFDNNKIRFAHLTTRTQNGDYSSEGDFKIRMDVIINEKAFIKTFYNSIINAINGIDRQEIENDWNYQLEEYEILKSGSHLIEEYLCM